MVPNTAAQDFDPRFIPTGFVVGPGDGEKPPRGTPWKVLDPQQLWLCTGQVLPNTCSLSKLHLLKINYLHVKPFRRLGHPKVPRVFKFELTYPSNFLESEKDYFLEKSEKVHHSLKARARRHVWKQFVDNCHPTNLSFKSSFCLELWGWLRWSQFPAILPCWKSENKRNTKNSIKKAGKSRNSKAERQGCGREGMTTSIAQVCCPGTNTKYLKIGRAITLARYALSFGHLM